MGKHHGPSTTPRATERGAATRLGPAFHAGQRSPGPRRDTLQAPGLDQARRRRARQFPPPLTGLTGSAMLPRALGPVREGRPPSLLVPHKDERRIPLWTLSREPSRRHRSLARERKTRAGPSAAYLPPLPDPEPGEGRQWARSISDSGWHHRRTNSPSSRSRRSTLRHFSRTGRTA